ncbi:MAG: aromatic ring-hydroxylating dioxygenase subunit alpha [Pseudomonadota bacterium]
MLDDEARPALPPLSLPITDRPETSFTLPAAWYTDPAVYEREKEAIFYRTWQYVAHKTAFREPGDYVTLQICDQNIFVMLGGDGELRAFYNVCQHRAHELLSERMGNVKSVIVCPYHAWTFEREGRLRGARYSDQRPGFDRAAYSLKQVRMEIFCDCVFVNLDPQATPLSELAGEMEADMRAQIPFLDDLQMLSAATDLLGETHQHAGWKVVVDKYVECYHCKHAHPDFASLISMKTYEHETGALWARQVGRDCRPQNSAYAYDPGEGYPHSLFWYLWPNTTFNILPGANEMGVYAIRPLGLEHSSFEGHILSADGCTDKDRAAYSANVLVPEDIALCESVQRGLKSKGYNQGPIIAGDAASGEGEQALHLFHKLVYEALTA